MGLKDKLRKTPTVDNGLIKDASIDKKAKEGPPPPPKEESPPPSYNPEDLVAPLVNLNLSETSSQRPPSEDQCIVHLKLLTALANLREDVSTAEGLFGLSDSMVQGLSDADKQEVLPRIREKRWQVYVARAVERFRVWWETCLPSESRMLQQMDLSSQGMFHQVNLKGRPLRWGVDRTPPLGTFLDSVMLTWTH